MPSMISSLVKYSSPPHRAKERIRPADRLGPFSASITLRTVETLNDPSGAARMRRILASTSPISAT
jgi:hypothetical protein